MKTRNLKKVKLPKLAKSIPYRGEPVEQYQHSKLYKCWYCGHVNTAGREKYDDGKSSMHMTYGMSYTPSRGTMDGDFAKLTVLRNIFNYRVSPKAGADGSPVPVKNQWSIVNHAHCANCGTATWGPGAKR